MDTNTTTAIPVTTTGATTNLADRKQYLITLINGRPDLPEDKKVEMRNGVDLYNSEETESLIELFEKSNAQRQRIENGEVDAVRAEQDKEDREALKKLEEAQHAADEAVAARLLAEIEAM